MDITVTIIATVLGSNALFAFIQYMITRHDSRKNVKGRLDRLEKDGLRTQLLLLILMRPEEINEILTLAEHYFVDLKGNWYVTSMFAKWCEEHKLEPDWFDNK